MITPDIFNNDYFTSTSLTATINAVEYQPQELGTWFSWNMVGVPTRSVIIEERDGTFEIIATAPVGAPAPKIVLDPSTARSLIIPRYPVELEVRNSEVQGFRQFGSLTELETVENRVNEKQLKGRRSHEATWEYARAGAISGLIKDKNGTTVYDLHSEFGVARNVHDINFDDPNTDVIAELTAAKEAAEDEMGGYMVDGWILVASKTIFRKITSHPSVKKAFDRYQEGAFLRADNRKGFKVSDDITVVSYAKGKLGTLTFMDEGDSYLCPVADDFYQTRFGPSEAFPNVEGIPLYSISQVGDFGMSLRMLIESHHVHWLNRPRAVVRIRAK